MTRARMPSEVNFPEAADPVASVRLDKGLDHEEADDIVEPVEDRSIPEDPESV